ncbi:hypothetical protein IMG5_109460, partial [Ichthyophthirius multifiliis]
QLMQQMPKTCGECENGNECINCKSDYGLYQKSCLKECPKGYENENGICVDCEDYKCKRCSTESNTKQP